MHRPRERKKSKRRGGSGNPYNKLMEEERYSYILSRYSYAEFQSSVNSEKSRWCHFPYRDKLSLVLITNNSVADAADDMSDKKMLRVVWRNEILVLVKKILLRLTNFFLVILKLFKFVYSVK